MRCRRNSEFADAFKWEPNHLGETSKHPWLIGAIQNGTIKFERHKESYEQTNDYPFYMVITYRNVRYIANPGDFIICEDNGDILASSDEEFRERYSEV